MIKFHNILFQKSIVLCFAFWSIIFISACAQNISSPTSWGGPPSPNVQNAPEKLDASSNNLPQKTTKSQNEAQNIQSQNLSSMPQVKVAILLPLSGPRAALGQSMLQAAQLALFDMGYDNFELIPRDTQGTTQGAVQAATMAAADGAELFLGPLFSENVKAVQSIAAKRNINVISFSTDWNVAARNVFVMGFMPFDQVQRITRYAAAQGIKNIGAIAPKDTYGNAVMDNLRLQTSQNAIKIEETVLFIPNDPTVGAQLKPLGDKRDKLSAIFLPVGSPQAQNISNGLIYYGLTPDKYRRLGTGLMDDPRLARENSLQGTWYAAPAPSMRSNFEKRYQETFGEQPLRIATLAYDATALAAVLAATGHQTDGKPAFHHAAITNPNGFSGIDGIFRFGSDGLVERGLSVLELRNGQIVEIDPAPSSFQVLGF